MKKENVKFLILPVLMILAYVAWYYWNKSKNAVAAIVAASGTTAAQAGTIAANTNAGLVSDKYYEYGSGKIYFEDRKPSTYKTVELLSFTPDLNARSAFKLN